MMSFSTRILVFLALFGGISFGMLRADGKPSLTVDQLQSQIVAQMKTCDDLTAQIASSNTELLRREKTGAPVDAITTVQASIQHFTEALAAAKQTLADLQSQMAKLSAAPQALTNPRAGI